nr:hypothetical protein GCM10020093_079930 [Planobispora longispora]
MLWSAAPAVFLRIPDLLVWIQELLAPPEEYGDPGDIYGMAQLFSGGRRMKITVWLDEYIHGAPAFALGAAPHVLLGLGACLLAARRGRPETGRMVVRLLAVVLVPVYGVRPCSSWRTP